MTAPKKRFQDSGDRLYELLDEVLVICPECRGRARVGLRHPEVGGHFAPRRLVCGGCSYTKDSSGQEVWTGIPFDPFFRQPLWLQGNFRGRVLWAYNVRHLRLLEEYVGASLREHRQREGLGWHNQSLVNRLPKWLKSGKNRDGVRRVIARLKQSLVS